MAAEAPDVAASAAEAEALFRTVGSGKDGLTPEEAARRLDEHGPNTVARERRETVARELAGAARSPLNARC